MKANKLLLAAGAAVLIMAGGSGADAGERWRGQDPGARAMAAQAAPGRANVARHRQSGNGNAAATRQAGAGNMAHTIQRGNGNEAEIVQTGDDNRGRIIQVGDGLSAAQHQAGGERGNIIQVNRGNATVDIDTAARRAGRGPRTRR